MTKHLSQQNVTSSQSALKSAINANAPKYNIRQQARVSVGVLCLCVAIGTIFIHLTEGVHPITSIYWAVVTMSSVGYGDIAIKHQATRMFVSIYALIGVACTGWSLGQFAAIAMQAEEKRQIKRVVKRGVTEAMIEEMDVTGDGEVDKMEFLCFMLVSRGRDKDGSLETILRCWRFLLRVTLL